MFYFYLVASRISYYCLRVKEQVFVYWIEVERLAYSKLISSPLICLVAMS